MKEKSHRTSERCYRCGVETYLDTPTRRLDGYSLYTASHVWIRVERQARRRDLRPGPRQFGWRRGAVEESGHPAATDEATGRMPGRPAAGGQGAAFDAGIG